MAFFLVRFGEMALKSSNVRKRWEKVLITNIEDAFMRAGVECRVDHTRGRIYVTTGNETAAVVILSRIFGIVSFSSVTETGSSMKELKQAAVRVAFEAGDIESFRIKARRTGSHPFTSMDVNRDVGEAVLEAFEGKGRGLKVDLHTPDLVINVEVRDNMGYIFTDTTSGPGGLPLGTQGTLVLLLSERDLEVEMDIRDPHTSGAWYSLLAAYLMMKRGCLVYPFVKDDGDRAAEAFRRYMEVFDPRVRIHGTPVGDILRDPKGYVTGARFDDIDAEPSIVAPVDGRPVYAPLSGLAPDRLREWMDDMVSRMETV